MIGIIFFVFLTWLESFQAQMVYMPRYMVRPVRRSAMDALERLRLPATRYFPPVDTEVTAYQGPSYFSGYPVEEPYAVSQDYVQPEPIDNYEYDNSHIIYRPAPQYAEEVYAQPEPIDDSKTYGELLEQYLMQEPQENTFEVQRRNSPNTTTTTTEAPSSTQKVQMTAVPSAPEKKDVKSLVVPDPVSQKDDEEGQKEEPLFRPLQSSQRTLWKDIRAKNAQQQKKMSALLNVM